MAVFSELYSNSYQSSAMTQSQSATFGGDNTFQQLRDQYGSANRLIVTNVGVEEYVIDLDGQSGRRVAVLFGKGSLVINPEDGIFFNTVKITQTSSGTSNASDVNLKLAKAVRVAS